MTWILDLDGVIWLADEPVPGSADAVARLRALGVRVVFVTNNSYSRRADQAAKLARMGIDTALDDVVTSAMAAARLVSPGERALVIGGPGLLEELHAAQADVVEAGSGGELDGVATVVVGMDPSFDFSKLAAATSALRSGARLIGTNDDATYPTAHGIWPGAGSLLAAVARAGGADPLIAGKPFDPMAALVEERIGPVDVAVGDRPSTDGQMARKLGARFGLVLSGVTAPGHGPIEPAPDREAADLRAFVEAEYRSRTAYF